ncbi:MAG: hypothetical protein O3A87_07340 [Verrucomicrobia bacterium]|nr:hypothetical protein [Verrucomicrobiota bacterium]MDA1006281.1 hypothetical protein [Verrucomicrobiota bacterium]
MLPRLASFLTALLLVACASTPAKPAASTNHGHLLSHEVVIDQRSGFLFSGNANMSGPFPTGNTTHLLLQVSSDGEPAANPAATRLLAAFPKALPHTATFLPDGESKGMIRTAGDRFEAFGKLNNERTEFTGTWFFDDLEGGNIHIAPRGTIFP